MLLGALLGAACGQTHGTVRPDDMSAAEHRRQAARETSAASAHLATYDAGDGARRDHEDQRSPFAVGDTRSSWHLDEAHRHTEKARAHEASADELERDEAEHCARVDLEERDACPVLAGAAGVEDVRLGVRIAFVDEGAAKRAAHHMQCHLAHARAEGWPRNEACPLYWKGVSIALTDRHVLVTAKDSRLIEAIRRAARDVALRGPTTT